MTKIHCLNQISREGLKLLTDDYKITENLADADAVLVRSANMHEMELPDGLEAIARAGAGVNNIPLEKCTEKGIVVFNTPGANANGVKELVLAGMLMAARDIHGGIEWVKENKDDAYCAGRKVAYYEMLDILKTELDIRDQDLKEFGLDIDLENKIA